MLRNLISVRPARTAGAPVRALGSGARSTVRRRSRAVAALEPLEGRALLSSLQLVNPSVAAADVSVAGSESHPQQALDGAFNSVIGQAGNGNPVAQAFLNYQPTASDVSLEFSTFSLGAGNAAIRTVSNPPNQPSTDLLTFVINPTGNQKAGDPVNITLTGSYGNVIGIGHSTFNVDYVAGGGTRQTLIAGANVDTNQPQNSTQTTTFTAAVGQTFQVQMSLNATSDSAVNRSVLDLDIKSTDIPNVTSTGGHLVSIEAGQSEVFGLGPDNTVWVFQDSTNSWTFTGGYALSISVGTDARGNDELWAVSGGNEIWRYTTQGGWVSTHGHLVSIEAGRGEVFGLGPDQSVWVFKDSTNNWTFTGGYALSISVGTANDGSDELWAVSGGNAIWRYTAGGGWFDTGGHLVSIEAGRGEVFGLGPDQSVWVFKDSTNSWTDTHGHALSISVGTANDGSDELWVVSGGNEVWRYTSQGNWFTTGGHLVSIEAGRGEVFGLGPDNSLWVYNEATNNWTYTQVFGIELSVGTDSGVDELWFRDPNNLILRYKA